MRVLLFTEIDLDDRAVLQMQEATSKATGKPIEGEAFEQLVCEGVVRASTMFYKQLPGVQTHQTVYLPPLIRKVGL